MDRTNIQARCEARNGLERGIIGWASELKTRDQRFGVEHHTVSKGASEEQHIRAKYGTDVVITLRGSVDENFREVEHVDTYSYLISFHLFLKSKRSRIPDRVYYNADIPWTSKPPRDDCLILDFIDYKDIVNSGGLLIYECELSKTYFVYTKSTLRSAVVSSRYKEVEGDLETFGSKGAPTAIKVKGKVVVDARGASFKCNSLPALCSRLEEYMSRVEEQRRAEISAPMAGACVLVAYSPGKVGLVEPYVLEDGVRRVLGKGESVVCRKIC